MHIVFWWESQKETPLGISRRRWQDNIKMALIQTGWGGMDWIDVVQDRDPWRALVNTGMNSRAQKKC
jgi:hypothetical protein